MCEIVQKVIIGIDPGLNRTGYGVLDISSGRARLSEAGVILTHPGTLPERVKEIYKDLAEIVDRLRPDIMALEQLYSSYKNPKTAILMGHARGVICLVAAQAGIPVVSYEATKVKKTMTGSGRAPKDQIQRAVKLELRLPKLPDPPDVADAIAIAFCHYSEARRTLY